MAGAGYKLFNTGDVLTAAQVNTYLMEQTTMVFADAAARTAALTGVVAEGMISYLKSTKQVEVYNGSAWVASDDPNAIQNTIVDAKGDLITATANDTPARLAVGNNGESLVADSSASTGLRWQGNFAAGKNLLLNGDFNIWQRGTSFNYVSTGGYTADRWVVDSGGSGNLTVTRQAFTIGQTDVPGNPNYFLQCAYSASGSSATIFHQRIENVATASGQTVTYSVWAKVSSGTKTGSFQYVQEFGSGGSSAVAGTFGSFTLTTSWQRISGTVTLPSVAGKTIGTGNYVYFRISPMTSDTITYSFANAQVELGSVATAFQTATGTLAGELAACQRYYQKSYNTGTAPQTNNTTAGIVFTQSPSAAQTDAIGHVSLKVEMRSSPTVNIYSYASSQLGRVSNNNGVDLAANSGAVTLIGTRSFTVWNNSGGTITPAFGGFVFHYTAESEL